MRKPAVRYSREQQKDASRQWLITLKSSGATDWPSGALLTECQCPSVAVLLRTHVTWAPSSASRKGSWARRSCPSLLNINLRLVPSCQSRCEWVGCQSSGPWGIIMSHRAVRVSVHIRPRSSSESSFTVVISPTLATTLLAWAHPRAATGTGRLSDAHSPSGAASYSRTCRVLCLATSTTKES